MCLACEMDALWFAEAEAAAALPRPAGERSTASASELAGEGPLDDGGGENPSPGFLRSARNPTSHQPGEVKSAFRCEETRSE
jgi:hypothetical protein